MLSFDVVVIGGGGAGLRAAIAAAQPGISVALVSKSHPLRSTTACTGGGINSVLNDMNTAEIESYIRDTILGGDYLNDQDAVEFMAKKSAAAAKELDRMGVPFLRDQAGHIAQSKAGGASAPRVCWTLGHAITHSLYEQYLRYSITDLSHVCLLELVVDDELQGLIALDVRSGKILPIAAKSVVIATGGAGRIYWQRTTNPVDCTGDGISICLDAGIALKDPEFIQFHPTALAENGILLSEGARGAGAYLLNRHGERFMQRYQPQRMELATRDAVSAAIETEIALGRGYGTGASAHVMLDLRHIPKSVLHERLKQVVDAAMKFEGLDAGRDLLPVRPACHYMMGGIDVVDYSTCSTAINGLFAVGECACISVQGANRLGGNALTEVIVFGKAAGIAAMKWAKNRQSPTRTGLLAAVKRWSSRFDEILNREGKGSLVAIRNELADCMWKHVGIQRNQQGLETALVNIKELKQEYLTVSFKDRGLKTDMGLVHYLEIGHMINVAHAITLGALARCESRGSHQRTDFPDRDDLNLMKHTLITKSGEEYKVGYRPVKVTAYLPVRREKK